MGTLLTKTLITDPTSDDQGYVLDDPAGTPSDKRSTYGNIITKAHGLSDSTVVGVASGVLTSGTDVAVADGGTGASTAAGARTNLGLVPGTDVQAFDAQLSDVAAITPGKGKVVVSNTTNITTLAAGTDGQILTADALEATGVKWATPAGAGDASTNTATSVDNEIALFSSTSGKLFKRATTTGILKGTSGVISAATAGTDYYNPGGTDVAIADGGTGQSTATAAFDALAPTTTEGDLIYHNGTDNVRLAKGTASQVLTMNAGATAPEWAAAGGGGAVTPRNEITLVDYSNPLGDATPEGMATTNTTGSSTVTFSSTLGLVLTTGTADPSASLASVGSGSTTTWRSSIFDHNPSFKCTYSQDMDGAATRYFIGIGSSGSMNFAESGKMIGIRMNQSGGVTTYYAVSNNGTTETATNITTAFTGSTGYGLGTVGAVYDIYVVKNSTTDIKYYVNGALAATLTTNLPSGVVTTSSRYLCAYMMLNGGGTANTLNIRRLVAEYDLY